MLKKVLIANRGEIAVRIIKTLEQLGIESVAIYSQFDQQALHVQQATQAQFLTGDTLEQTYLNQEQIIKIAQEMQVDGIHPGYGFLAENAKFAQAVIDAGLIFIGPSSQAIELMGDKLRAKKTLQELGVPLVPGYHKYNKSFPELLKEATKIGFPVLIKAASGGGGKAMHVAVDGLNFKDLYEQAKREAKKSFGDDTLILEKYLEDPRHIEVQVVADQNNNYLSLGHRECSIQRRYQKIIEEAPAPGISKTLSKKLNDCALKIAQFINYQGIGTVEFLIDKKEQFYFLEMNTRIQVEHPVTEKVTGIDLVAWQINIANGASIAKEKVNIKGHSIEARVYAEDPSTLLPAVGEIEYLREPGTDSYGLRIDSGIKQGDKITLHYDPILAKVISYANTREAARLQLLNALAQYYLIGVKNNISLLTKILETKQFIKGKINTQFIENNSALLNIDQKTKPELVGAACLVWLLFRDKKNKYPPIMNSWRLNLHHKELLIFNCNGEEIKCAIEKKESKYLIYFKEVIYTVKGKLDSNNLELFFNKVKSNYYYVINKNKIYLFKNGQRADFIYQSPVRIRQKVVNKTGSLSAPMPGMIVDIKVKSGAQVQCGEPLMVIEAMKMEHVINAPCAGKVKSLLNKVGDLVEEGQDLLCLDKKEE